MNDYITYNEMTHLNGFYFIVYCSNPTIELKTINLKNIYLTKDKQICNELELSLNEYRNILKGYNANISVFRGGRSTFSNIKDIEQCIEHLNDYLLMKKLRLNN